MSHTPAPWNAHCDGPDSERRMAIVVTSFGFEFIECTKSGKDYTESCANARLCAAAPELLAALREAMAAIRTFHGPGAWDIYYNNAPEMKRMRDAIAKATR